MEYEILLYINILSAMAIVLTVGYHYISLVHEKKK